MSGMLRGWSELLFRKKASENAETDQMNTGRIKILGWSGSLRKNSFDRSILSAALEMVPEDATLGVFDLEGMPLFNPD